MMAVPARADVWAAGHHDSSRRLRTQWITAKNAAIQPAITVRSGFLLRVSDHNGSTEKLPCFAHIQHPSCHDQFGELDAHKCHVPSSFWIAGLHMIIGTRQRALASQAEQDALGTAERLANLILVFCVLSWRVFWMTVSHR
jgi:hypothetical protein